MKTQSVRCILVCLSIAALVFATASLGQAEVLTFDDITSYDQNGITPYDHIPDGYGEFYWNRQFFSLNDVIRAWFSEFGIETEGVVSGNHAAFIHRVYWVYYGSVSIWRDGLFNFDGAYLTAGPKREEYLTDYITVEGWANGTLIYSQTVEVNNQTPTWCDFSYRGIDTLVFSSYYKHWLVIDNFTFNSETKVDIDIKPGSDPNSLNLKSNGVVPVAVLTTDDFIALKVNPDTVFFAGAEPERWTYEDVDGDGDMDLLLHFRTKDLNLTAADTEATLVGETYDGAPIKGTDPVRIVSGKGK